MVKIRDQLHRHRIKYGQLGYLMKSLSLCFAIVIISYSTLARADCKEDASAFAVRVCNDIAKSDPSLIGPGRQKDAARASVITSTVVNASGNMKVKVRTKTYVSVVNRQLSKSRFDVYQCRRYLALSALKSECNKNVARFKVCARPEFGLLKWNLSANGAGNSGWMGGGHSRGDWCNNLAGQIISQRHITTGNQVVVLSTDESRRKSTFGRAEYNYFCNLRVDYDPIYNSKEDPLCGLVGSR